MPLVVGSCVAEVASGVCPMEDKEMQTSIGWGEGFPKWCAAGREGSEVATGTTE